MEVRGRFGASISTLSVKSFEKPPLGLFFKTRHDTCVCAAAKVRSRANFWDVPERRWVAKTLGDA